MFTWLSGITNWLIGGALAVLIGSGMWMVHDYKSQATKIATLEADLKIAQSASEVAKANLALRDKTIDTLNARLTTRLDDMQKTCDLLQDAAQDKSPDADKPIGGILGDILGKIDSTKKTPKN
jgi:hypothetical protein